MKCLFKRFSAITSCNRKENIYIFVYNLGNPEEHNKLSYVLLSSYPTFLESRTHNAHYCGTIIYFPNS